MSLQVHLGHECLIRWLQVTTQTSSVAGGGSSANAYITLKGEHGDYGPCLLERAEGEEGANALSEGRKDVFDVCALDGNDIQSIY